MLHTHDEPGLDAVFQQFFTTDLPNLWKPKRDHFIHTEQFPLPGSGKLDLRKIQDIASQSIHTP